MKKFYIFLMLGVLFSLESYSQEGFLMNAKQMRDYENDVKFLECVYSGVKGCQHTKTIEQSRTNIAKMKKGYAAGVFAGKKARLDSKSDKVLPKISVTEAKKYIKQYSLMSPVQQAEEFLDSAILKTVMVMPSAGKLEAEAEGKKYEGPQTVSKVYEGTKQDMLNSFKELENQKQVYKIKPAYITQKSKPTLLDKTENYVQNQDMTKVFYKTKRTQHFKQSGEKQNMESVLGLVRDSDYNIRINGSETLIASEQVPVRKEDNVMNANFDGFDITDTKENKASTSQYFAEEDALRGDRINNNKIIVLEMLVNKTEALLKQAYDLDQKGKEKNIRDARKLMTQAYSYYNGVLTNKDQRSKNIIYRYRGLQDTMRKVGL